MNGVSETPATDPPAYSPAAPWLGADRRSIAIADTRALILANASIMKPPSKSDGPIEVIVGKTKRPASTCGTRSFTSQTSNVTIRINNPPESSPNSNGGSAERRASESSIPRAGEKYYAALVNRTSTSNDVHMLILGEPQDTIEEALEWMLDRTMNVITDVLSRHRKQVGLGCCTTCGYATGLRASENGHR